MVTMENREEVLQTLERFTRLKQKEIPKELEDYLQHVAKTGDTIFKWASVKSLIREKLLGVIKHFNEDSPRLEEIPNYPNVDPFNYETMKSSLLERLDQFNAAPFTIQRLCELLIDPRKQYSRIDKFMRALEKTILVVSTIDPGRKRTESENGDSLDSSVVNGDLSLEVNIDIEMENEGIFNNVDERNGNAEEAASSALKASCPRTDDTEQPKAKKVKLELGDEEQTKEKSETTANAAVEEMEDAATEESSVKPKAEAECKEAQLNTTDAAAADKKPESDAVIPTTEKDVTDGEIKPAKVVVKEEKDETASKSAAVIKDDAKAAGDKAVEKNATDNKNTLDVKNKTTEKDEEKVIAAAKAPQAAEKIVEKQDTEIAEKLTASEKEIKQETDAKPTAKTEAEKTVDTKETAVVAEVAIEQPKESEAVKEATESSTAAAKPSEKESEEKDTATAKETIDNEDKKETDAADESAKTEKTKSEAKPEAKEAEAEEAAADKKIDKEKTETKPATIAETVAETTLPEAVVDKENTKPDASSAVATATATPVPIETDEPAAQATAKEPVVAATTSPTVAPPTAAVPPALALNDQPMEDTPADEEVHTASSTAVEEVVMAESGAAAADMATDDLAKDEPAAMEVDDTSQEVMDQ